MFAMQSDAAVTPSKPNILLILTDQHMLSALGAYGPTPCRTPNLDRLARQGVLFRNAYTTSPLCSPARASVITGQWPHTHGVTDNIWSLTCQVNEIPDGPNLLPRRLQSAGYRNGYSGKWHLGTDVFPGGHIYCANAPYHASMPRDVGFEGQNFPGHGGGGYDFDEMKRWLDAKGLKHNVKSLTTPSGVEFRWAGILDQPAEGTVASMITDHTLGLIDRFAAGAEPFFIWHNFWGPHAPYWAPREYYDVYRDVALPEWPSYRWPAMSIPGPHQASYLPAAARMQWADWAELIRHYYAFTTLIDAQIGRMLDALERSGALDNTVVIMAADHGESLGQHGGLFNKGFTHFEETLHIPLIVRLPGGLHGGREVNDLVSLADVYPTVLDLAGLGSQPFSVSDLSAPQGQSLLPLCRGDSTAVRDEVCIEFHGLHSQALLQRTIRHKNFKYGFNSLFRDELYDLDADPHEMINLIDHPDFRDTLRQLRERMIAWMHRTRDQAFSYVVERLNTDDALKRV
jgi:arylsulfatase A-like enzyme